MNNVEKVMSVDRYFEGLTVDDVKQISPSEAIYLRKGEVIMVRSENVPQFKDHFYLITGHPVVKPHGLRPQGIVIPTSPDEISLLDFYTSHMGAIVLLLNPIAREKFIKFYCYEPTTIA